MKSNEGDISMAKGRRSDPPAVKAWVKTQEALMELEDAIAEVARLAAREPANAVLRARADSYWKLFEKLTIEVRKIEQQITARTLDELKSERDDVRQIKSRKKR